MPTGFPSQNLLAPDGSVLPLGTDFYGIRPGTIQGPWAQGNGVSGPGADSANDVPVAFPAAGTWIIFVSATAFPAVAGTTIAIHFYIDNTMLAAVTMTADSGSIRVWFPPCWLVFNENAPLTARKLKYRRLLTDTNTLSNASDIGSAYAIRAFDRTPS